ncbi:MAG: hypothetical protein RI947_1136 [Candidatus Parcubacteria bacterium]
MTYAQYSQYDILNPMDTEEGMEIQSAPGAYDSIKKRILARLEDQPIADDLIKPQPAPEYPYLAASLAINAERGVTEFAGGPLDLDKYGIDNDWVSPYEVRDGEGFSNFHLIYLNCTPDKMPADTQVILNLASELDLKLDNKASPEAQRLRHIIAHSEGKPLVILRPSITGALYYPEITTPNYIPDEETLDRRLKLLEEVSGLHIPYDRNDLSVVRAQEFVPYQEYPDFQLGVPRVIESPYGKVFAYAVYSPDDPWKYYDIYSSLPLDQLPKDQIVPMRVDSGCDIGQMYNDQGCDCHPQLLAAIKQICARDENEQLISPGIIINAPTQDGRGYGMNTKMETEAFKRGTEGVMNKGIDAMDTVTAAKTFFHSDDGYDIRTFDGVGRVLKQLGFLRLGVYTDNKLKMSGLKSAGLDVTRIKTDTLSNGELTCKHHVLAKHNSALYYNDEDHHPTADDLNPDAPKHLPGDTDMDPYNNGTGNGTNNEIYELPSLRSTEIKRPQAA